MPGGHFFANFRFYGGFVCLAAFFARVRSSGQHTGGPAGALAKERARADTGAYRRGELWATGGVNVLPRRDGPAGGVVQRVRPGSQGEAEGVDRCAAVALLGAGLGRVKSPSGRSSERGQDTP